MDESSTQYSLVRRYLANLGYQESLVATEVPIKEAQEIKRVDLIVYEHGHPHIAIEIKSEIPDKKDTELLKFHPYVRRLQSNAATLGAPYYLLTDGISFLWFMTDTSGRPKLLAAPLYSSEANETHIQPSKDFVVQALRSLQQYLYNRAEQGNELATLIILAKLLSERGDKQLRQHLLYREPLSSSSYYFSLLELTDYSYMRVDRNYLKVAFDILSNVSFSSGSPYDLLRGLDEVFFNRRSEPRIARWLSNLLFRLGQIPPQNGNTILDIFCNMGNILAAAGLASKKVTLWGICPNIQSALWTQLQQAVIGRYEGTVLVEKIPPYHMLHSPLLPEPTHIITVPPFGTKIDMHESRSQLLLSGVNQIEDIYLELAINWVKPHGRVVMLVPEGLLFSKGKRKITRWFLRDKVRITAIISLESGALLPYSGIKTSILVLDNEPDSNDYEVFMAQVKEITIKDAFDSLENSQIAEVLEDFERWTNSKQIKSNTLSWVVPISRLDIDNLTVRRYAPKESYFPEQLTSPYQMVPLRRLTKYIKRGANIKLDSAGAIRVIGPAVIRPMTLDTSSLAQTTEEKIPLQSLTVQTGDILLNNISTYLGAAAVANEEVAGSYFNSHVILIRPDTSQVLPEYLAAAINSDLVKPQLQQRATGSLLPSLSLERLADVTIPVPNLAIQRHIVNIIEKAHNDLLQAQKQFNNAESRFIRLIQSLSEEE